MAVPDLTGLRLVVGGELELLGPLVVCQGPPDSGLEVAVAAKTAGRMLFTLDKGFGDIRAHPPGTHPGMVILRLGDGSASAVRQAVTNLLDDHPLEALAGAVVVLQRGRIRVRWAP